MNSTLKATILFCPLSLILIECDAQSYWSKRYDFHGGNDIGTQLRLYQDSVAIIQISAFCDVNTRECTGLVALGREGEVLWKSILYDTIEVNYGEAFFMRNDSIYLNLNYQGNIADTLNGRIQTIDLQGNPTSYRNYSYNGFTHLRTARGLSGTPSRACVTFGYQDDTLNYPREMTRVYDQNWNLLFERSVPNTPAYPFVRNSEACCTEDSGVAIAYSARNNQDEFIAVVEKYNSIGSLEWRTQLPHVGGWPGDRIKIEECAGGGFIGLWEFDTTGLYITDVPTLVFKLSELGEVVWERMDLTEQIQLFDVFEGINGDIYGCGRAQEWFWGEIEDAYTVGYIIKLSPSGEFVWDRRISDTTDGAFRCYLNSGDQFKNGDLIFAGAIIDSIFGFEGDETPTNIWTVRLDSSGCLSPGCADWQYPVSTSEITTTRKQKPFNVYPIPAREHIYVSTKIDTYIGQGRFMISLHDMSGQVLLHQIFNPYEILEISTSTFPSGSYILAIWNNGTHVQTEQLILR